MLFESNRSQKFPNLMAFFLLLFFVFFSSRLSGGFYLVLVLLFLSPFHIISPCSNPFPRHLAPPPPTPFPQRKFCFIDANTWREQEGAKKKKTQIKKSITFSDVFFSFLFFLCVLSLFLFIVFRIIPSKQLTATVVEADIFT